MRTSNRSKNGVSSLALDPSPYITSLCIMRWYSRFNLARKSRLAMSAPTPVGYPNILWKVIAMASTVPSISLRDILDVGASASASSNVSKPCALAYDKSVFKFGRYPVASDSPHSAKRDWCDARGTWRSTITSYHKKLALGR